MKILLTAREVEQAVIAFLDQERGIKVKQQDITWTTHEGLNPLTPMIIEVKS